MNDTKKTDLAQNIITQLRSTSQLSSIEAFSVLRASMRIIETEVKDEIRQVQKDAGEIAEFFGGVEPAPVKKTRQPRQQLPPAAPTATAAAAPEASGPRANSLVEDQILTFMKSIPEATPHSVGDVVSGIGLPGDVVGSALRYLFTTKQIRCLGSGGRVRYYGPVGSAPEGTPHSVPAVDPRQATLTGVEALWWRRPTRGS